jgi:hypothetical protein
MGQLKAWRPGSVDDRTNRSRRYDGMQEDRCLGALGERIETRQSYRTSKVPRCDRCFVRVRITKKKGVLPLLGSVLGRGRVQRGVIGRCIDPLAQRFE